MYGCFERLGECSVWYLSGSVQTEIVFPLISFLSIVEICMKGILKSALGESYQNWRPKKALALLVRVVIKAFFVLIRPQLCQGQSLTWDTTILEGLVLFFPNFITYYTPSCVILGRPLLIFFRSTDPGHQVLLIPSLGCRLALRVTRSTACIWQRCI